jgi:chemotaxis protein histidine kinase CheA
MRASEATEAFDDGLELGSDVELIAAKVDLRGKTKPKRAQANFDPVAAAEAAMSQLGTRFDVWLIEQVGHLTTAWQATVDQGLDPYTIDQLYRAAHDLRGEASTFGYPLIGDVCGSLCHLLDASPDGRFLPAALIAQHVQAVRAMVAEKAKDTTNKTARQLVERLTEVTRDYATSITSAADRA